MVTSNHIHLLVSDDGDRDTIPKSIQLVAGRTGQEYNHRKKLKGAFWEDRYHATAVESNHHLAKCMVYIDMNMVRAGVVKYPKQWPFCGYNEILSLPKRYRVIDFRKLLELLQVRDIVDLQQSCRARVEEVLASANCFRESKWTESIAVGSEQFVAATKQLLGSKAKGRQVIGENETYELREAAAPYRAHFDLKNSVLRPENTYFWNAIV
jgi:hypothetical protein